MGTAVETMEYLLDQLVSGGGVGFRARKMFGNYALYLDLKVVALVCNDQLFVRKLDVAGLYLAETGVQAAEAPPYPGAKMHYLVGADLWENSEWLVVLLRIVADVLPLPKPKAGKRTRKNRTPSAPVAATQQTGD